jgi:hypothetical protein
MNKGVLTKIQKLGERMFKSLFKTSPIKQIYIVKLKEVHYRPESKSNTNNTYNLYSYEDFNIALMYINSVYDIIIENHEKLKFKSILDTESTEIQFEGNNRILYEKTIRMAGIDERNISQTKLIKLFIEEINLGIK